MSAGSEMRAPFDDVPPNPAALIESMRAFGYALPTAIADLIDNSISAGAHSIDVVFHWAGERSLIAVIDDGRGMDRAALVEAMRLGSRSPLEVRAADDLGRFGLGLKSAAWSQGRRLTVISKTAATEIESRCWDLDHVASTGRWSLLHGASDDAAAALGDRLPASHGTAVVIESLDRLVGAAKEDDRGAQTRFLGHARLAHQHLAMVFHRFLSGRDRLTISVSDSVVEPWDPFMEHKPTTLRLPTEPLRLSGRTVEVAPYVLPHVSKLTPDEHRIGAGPGGWNQQQGFYVYRARRLLVAGGWLGLKRMQREEHHKLARIRVDLDNAMDEAWQIDVRKATARVPGPLEDELRRIAAATRQRAADAYRFRGKAIARSATRDATLSFVWQVHSGRDGATSFRVNRQHPVLQSLTRTDEQAARSVEATLRLVEENLPIETIVMESREHPDARRPRPFDGDQPIVAELLRDAHRAMVAAGSQPQIALSALANIEPFDSHPELVQAFREEIAP